MDGIKQRQGIDHSPIGPESTGVAFDLRSQEALSSPPQAVSIATSPAVSSSHNAGRRGFLRALGVGVAAVAANAVAPNVAWSRDFKDSEMDEEDKIIARALSSVEGTEPEMDMMEGDKATKPTEIQIQKFIDLIINKAKTSNKGVHMQQHENVMWLIAYFNYKKEILKGILYYPSKIGLESKFVKVIAKDPKVKNEPFDRSKIGKTGTTDIYTKEGEELHYTNKIRGIECVVDVGTAYVIIPKGTPIIEYIDKSGKKIAMLAECRNPIKRFLSECNYVKVV